MKFRFNKIKAVKYIKSSKDKESDTVFVPSLGSDATKSIKAMRTTIINGGYKDIIEAYFPEEPSYLDVDKLIKTIEAKVKALDINNLKDLENIFHLIHLWGGNAGRSVYQIRRGGFTNNLKDINAYKKLVMSAISFKKIEDLIEEIAEFERNTHFISVAFITKHTRYFSALNKTYQCIPIYDSVMSKNYMLKFNKKQNQYMPINAPTSSKMPSGREELFFYWNNMFELSKEYKISLMDLERILFVNAR